ncbi:MAG: preprotein translocase subunit SecG [bacterium]|nr:preprotein translocase subunit SecG [bacterium]
MSFLAEVLPYLQVGVAILLVIAILLQQRGSGLSATFGGEGNVYRTKRGLEKILFISTLVLGALFLILAFLNLLAR